MKIAALSVAAAALCLTGAAASQSSDNTITVRDLTPKFLDFYNTALAEKADPDRRWALWKERYGFAAVPPGPRGDAMARGLLDGAWDRYPSVMPAIRAGVGGFTPSPEKTLAQVTSLLEPDKPVTMTLLVYVGALEPNAFTMGMGGAPTVAAPVEMDPALRAVILTHEFTHATQISMGSLSGGWERSIGVTALSEGLAMQVTHKVHPKIPIADVVSHRPGWYSQCLANKKRVLADVQSAAAQSDSETVYRFTIGAGPAGIEREAYCAGWLVTGHWLKQGMTYAQIARIKEADAPARISTAIAEILGERG